MNKKTVRDVDVSGKRVLVRVDFNVPLKEGTVTDNSRIKAALPTIKYLLGHDAKVILMSHLGRPKGPEDKLRLDPVAIELSELLDRPVAKVNEIVGTGVQDAVEAMQPGDILLLENLRFDEREKKNDPEFAQQLANLADIYINDAFGSSHRAHASVAGIAANVQAVAGLLLEKEVDTLSKTIENPERPFIAVLGGSKVSDKLGVINNLLDIVDAIIIGGGMCFTFLKAKGFNIGKSLLEEDKLEYCKEAIEKANEKDIAIYLPSDLIVATEIGESVPSSVVNIADMPDDMMGLDIGAETVKVYSGVIKSAQTIIWNGPMGVFEIDQFANGTKAIAEAIANSTAAGATSVVGGGDSIAALKKFHLEDKVSFVSTGGGASLELLEGKKLPGVEALQDK